MNIQESKIELVKQVLNIENPSLIKKINTLLKDEAKDFQNTKAYVQEELRRYENGEAKHITPDQLDDLLEKTISAYES